MLLLVLLGVVNHFCSVVSIRLGKGVWVKAAVGDFIGITRRRESCVGEILCGVGKDSFSVCFYGIAVTRTLKSKQLSVLTEDEVLDYASAANAATNGGLNVEVPVDAAATPNVECCHSSSCCNYYWRNY